MQDLIDHLDSKGMAGTYSVEHEPENPFPCALNFANGWTYLGESWEEILSSVKAEGI